MLIQRANKYCAEPTPYQAQAMGQWVGACRHEYNHALERRQYEYRNYGFSLAYVPQAKELTVGVRRSTGWASSPSTHCKMRCVTSTRHSVASSRSCAGTPRRERSSRTTPSRCRQRMSSSSASTKTTVPSSSPRSDGCGSEATALPAASSARSPSAGRPANGSPASCGRAKYPTLRRDRTWQSASTAASRRSPPPRAGQLIDPLNVFDAIRPKLAKLQKRLARKVKLSSNWYKLKGKISRLRMHEANARKDFLHKETTKLANSHGVYRMEKLRVRDVTAIAKGNIEEPGKNVAQKSGLNRSILDQGWGMFAAFLAYKEQERGGRVEFTPAPYTSLHCPNPLRPHAHQQPTHAG